MNTNIRGPRTFYSEQTPHTFEVIKPPNADPDPGGMIMSTSTSISTSATVSTLEGKVRKRKRRTKLLSDRSHFVCYHCETTDTPTWRRGPAGPKTLCNACGIRWAKIQKEAEARENVGQVNFILNSEDDMDEGGLESKNRKRRKKRKKDSEASSTQSSSSDGDRDQGIESRSASTISFNNIEEIGVNLQQKQEEEKNTQYLEDKEVKEQGILYKIKGTSPNDNDNR
eukprot:TRINITY_DN16353_c0_g1_i1.p1 TRINITY_DN16353_c0_g1~~TRINITY_DN16353_c0_g1_i1.p1  ORF type:complete len:226 (-),score=46.42 TRINITY_DN16353_c0_g1_i1:10-687(-)